MEHVAIILRTRRRYRVLSLCTQKDKSSATSHPDILHFSWADGTQKDALIRKFNQTPSKHKYGLVWRTFRRNLPQVIWKCFVTMQSLPGPKNFRNHALSFRQTVMIQRNHIMWSAPLLDLTYVFQVPTPRK